MSPAPSPKKKKRPAPARQTVSGQLLEFLRASGKTPYTVAQEAEIAPSTLTRFVNGERGLSTRAFDEVCAVLKLELREKRRGKPTG